MIDLHPLLQMEGSALASVLRFAVVGLEAQLNSALNQSGPSDAGQEECRRIVTQLRAVLQGSDGAAPVQRHAEAEILTLQEPEPTASLTMPEERPASSLDGVRQEFLNDPAVKLELGSGLAGAAFQTSQSETELWQRLHVLLLRTSPGVAANWRKRLQQAAADYLDAKTDALLLPGDREELLIPGLSRTGALPALWLSPQAPLDAQLGDKPTTPIAAIMAEVVSVALWYMNADLDLHHALKNVYQFGVTPLHAKNQKPRVEQELIRRYERLEEAESGGDALKLIMAWAEVDEAIHSLLHKPVGPASSWWRQMQNRARDTVVPLRSAVQQLTPEQSLFVQVPSGAYASCRDRTDNASDKTAEGPGKPGDIVVCLRVFWKYADKESPGRVLYRTK